MSKTHQYRTTTRWTGNAGLGTRDYKAYRRDHRVDAPGKQHPILCSSDPAFRGDPSFYNPEELLVASLSACHMLWMLHLCADAGIVVHDYEDSAEGSMMEDDDGFGWFDEVVLHPRMTIADESRIAETVELHERAHERCFIAASVNFTVRCEPYVTALPGRVQ